MSWSPRRPGRARPSSASSPSTSPCTAGRKAFYTTPIKALSNQKYADLAARYGADEVGLLTGDNTRQRRGAGRRDDHRGAAQHALRRLPDARRPRLRGDGRGALPRRPVPRRGLGGGDHPPAGRRPRWCRCRRRSATRRSSATGSTPCAATPRSSSPEHRPVPLWQHVLVGPPDVRPVRGRDDADHRATDGRVAPARPEVNRELRSRPATAADGARPARPRAAASRAAAPAAARPSRADVVEQLDRAGLLPAITFIFSRAGCDAAVAAVPVRRACGSPRPRRRDEIRAFVEERTRRHPRRGPGTSWATGSGSTASSAASPPTTPACCRPSRRSSRSSSPRAWSRRCSPPRRWRSASTCRPARWCWRSWSSGTARPTPTSRRGSTPS